MKNNLKWSEWNRQGFIPGPEETEDAFRERIAFCLNLVQQLTDRVGEPFPFAMDDSESKHLLQEVFPLTQELYGIQPEWVPLFFSNTQLAPWHGGCAWIFQLDDETPMAAFLQLRAHFRTSSKFLGIYQREELIAHEIAHVGRMLYQEPQFEEMIAYQSSSSWWRRWLGPIVQSAKESFIFILLLGGMILTDFAFLFFEPHLAAHLWWFKLIPLGLILFALIRLIYRHHIFKCCLKQLETLYPTQAARHLMYRLRDQEIKEFSHLRSSAIQESINQRADNSFRWRFLQTLYPFSEKST